VLTRLQLGNFKSWQSLEMELGAVNLIFGANSSGKTSILQALLMLKQTVASYDRGQVINFGGGDRDYVDLGSYHDLVFQHNVDQRINISLAWFARYGKFYSTQDDEVPTRLSYEARWRGLTDRVVIERLNYNNLSDPQKNTFFRMERKDDDKYSYQVPKGLKETRGRNADLSSPERGYAIPVQVSQYYSDFDPLEFNLHFEELMNKITYLGPLRRSPNRSYQWTGSAPREIGRGGEYTLDALIASYRRSKPKSKKNSENSLIEDVSEWLQRLGIVASFQVNHIDDDKRFYKTQIKITPKSSDASLVDVGFGISQVLPVITLLFFAPERSIILMEQPELHLHPKAQSELADLLLYVAEKRHLQLIVESHSEHLLRRLQLCIAQSDHKFATPENVKSYYCQYGENGSTLKSVTPDIFGQIRDWPENFFGDLAGDLDAMIDAGLERRRRELTNGR
jgi:predicted ATPase